MRTAIVVGAGIGGLATAGALARTGWQVTVLEREERLRRSQSVIMLWPNGLRALRSTGLDAGIDGIATTVANCGVRRLDGQWLSGAERSRRDPEDQPLLVHRCDLQDLLVAGLGEAVEIRTGVQVRSVHASGQRPTLSDGHNDFAADLVVGADGVDSCVRRRFAPDSVFRSTGQAVWRAVIPWYRAPQLDGQMLDCGQTIGPGQQFLHASFGGRGQSAKGGVYWMATALGAPRPEPAESQLALLRRWFTGWPEPTGLLLTATEASDLVQSGVGELRTLPQAFGFAAGTGGFALVGDAGHSMAHYLAQGACLALEDAATLQRAVADAPPGRTLGLALEEYSRIRRPRIAKVLAHTRRIGALLQPKNGLTGRARTMAIGLFAPRVLDRAYAEASDWRPNFT